MINPSELLFVVDENNNPIESLPRDEVHAKGLWHRCSQIVVINSQKQILCQKRSKLKDNHPDMWEANFGGHLGPDEDFLDNALKETEEELGLQQKEKDMIFFEVFKSVEEKEFQGVYYTRWDGDLKTLSLEEEEVSEVAWKEIVELEKEFHSADSNWVQHGYEIRLLEHLKAQDF